MKRFKQRLSIILIFLFLVNFFPKLNLTLQVRASSRVDDIVALVGNFTLEGTKVENNWKPDDKNNFMKPFGNGIYEAVVDFKEAGSYEYKVALNKSWDENYPSQNRQLNLTEPKRVIFRFDNKNKRIIDSVNEPQEFKLSATLVGNLNDFVENGQFWNPEDANFDLSYIGGGFFKGTFKLSPKTQNTKFEYKVAYDHKWSNGEVGQNREVQITSESDVTFLANPYLNLCVDSINNPWINTVVSIIGQVREGNTWDVSTRGYEFDYLDGDGKFIYRSFLNAGRYEYKACENYSWDSGGIPRSGNKVLNIPEGGKYVIFIADVKNVALYDSLNDYDKVAEILGLENPIISPEITLDGKVIFRYKNDRAEKVSVAGSFNGWDKNANPMIKENGLWTLVLILNPGEYQYKFVVTENGNEYWVNDPSNSNVVDDGYGGKNSKLVVPSKVSSPVIEGNKVIFNYLDLTGKAREVYLAGSMTNWGDGKLLMTKGEDNVWSISLQLKPGKYLYKFIVDGNWMTDPQNPRKEGNPPFDNSVLYVPGLVDIYVPFEVEQNTSIKLIAKSMKEDGALEDYQNVEWSLIDNPNQIASLSDEGVLTLGQLPEGEDTIKIKISAKDKASNAQVSKEVQVVREASEVPEGRLVVLVGTVQHLVGANDWDPSSQITRMKHIGDGLYKFTIKDVPPGIYEYKVAMGSWNENYGKDGTRDGANIQMQVTKKQDITFYYSDASHIITDSTKYVPLLGENRPKLVGLDKEYVMKDLRLTGVYSVSVYLRAGTYRGIRVLLGNDDYEYPEIVLNEDREVTFSYDYVTGLIFNNASQRNIDTSKIYYDSRDLSFKEPFGAVKIDENVKFRIRTGQDVSQVKLVVLTPNGKESIDMTKTLAEDNYIWSTNYTPKEKGMYQYYFIISNGSEVKAFGDDDGLYGKGKADDLGKVLYYGLNVYLPDFKTPDWMKNAVIYHIFPDRFYNGDKKNDYSQKFARGSVLYEFYDDWYAIPEVPSLEDREDYKGTRGDKEWCNEMYGGDIEGVIKRLDYLKALGINVIYFNPISKSISNHRYDATDYKELDPLLGSMDDFVRLVKEAKKRGMKIILDGVLNHVSDDSIYFDRYGKYMTKGKPLGAYQYWSRVYDLMNLEGLSQLEAENRVQEYFRSIGITDFHYKDWFRIENRKVDVGKPTEHYYYEGWWGFDSMPVIQALNGSEYQVKSWAEEVIDGEDSHTRYWLRKGASGWRLDVANEVSDETWVNFRRVVKEEGDNVIIGEIWDDATRYLLGDMYDSVMNYRFRGALLDFLMGQKDSEKVMETLELIREQYPREAFYAMFNLIDSHDTQRAISAFDGYQKSVKDIANPPSENAKKLLKLAALMQMTYPGAPVIYYGDEAGQYGADDPDNRRAFPWGKGDRELVEWYAKLANIRNNYEVLRTGEIKPILAHKDVLAYVREKASDKAIIVINRGDSKSVSFNVPYENGTKFVDLISGQEIIVLNGNINLNLNEKSGVILVNKVTNIAIDGESLKPAYDPNFVVEKRIMHKNDAEEFKLIRSLLNTENEKVFSVSGKLSREVLYAASLNDLLLSYCDKNIEVIYKAKDILRNINDYFELNISNIKSAKLNKIRGRDFIGFNISSNIETLYNTVFKTKIEIDKKKFNNAYVYYFNGSTFVYVPSRLKDKTVEFETKYLGDFIILNRPLDD